MKSAIIEKYGGHYGRRKECIASFALGEVSELLHRGGKGKGELFRQMELMWKELEVPAISFVMSVKARR